jgi:hypothetical protein
MTDFDNVQRFDAGDWFSPEPCVSAFDYDALLAEYNATLTALRNANNGNEPSVRLLLDRARKELADKSPIG